MDSRYTCIHELDFKNVGEAALVSHAKQEKYMNKGQHRNYQNWYFFHLTYNWHYYQLFMY